MNEKHSQSHLDDEIDVREIILLLWKKKYAILGLTSIFAISSVIYALSLQNIYTSSTILVPTDQQESLNTKLSSYKNLAGLAGVKLPSSGENKSREAVARILSFKFFSERFIPNIKLENLMAVQEWVAEENKLIYSESDFDVKQNKWIRKVDYPLQTMPSNQESYEKYREIIDLNIDDDTGFVFISINHVSPHIAKKWLDIIIFNINSNMRELDKQKAQNSINFLNQSSKTTNIQSIKEAIAALLEEQMQTLMLASSNEDYIFKVIEAPIAPEIKTSPIRSIICIVITLIGGFLSLIIVLVQHYWGNLVSFLTDES